MDSVVEKNVINLTGTWNGQVFWKGRDQMRGREDNKGPGTPVMKLDQDGGTLTGSYECPMGTFEIAGKVIDDEVELNIKLAQGDSDEGPGSTMQISALVNGSGLKMRGNIETKFRYGVFVGARAQ